MIDNIEHTILTKLVFDGVYAKKSLTILKKDYFSDIVKKGIFSLIESYYIEYKSNPSLLALLTDLPLVGLPNKPIEDSNLPSPYDQAKQLINNLKDIESISREWITNKTEDFCRGRAYELAVQKSVVNKRGKKSEDVIKELAVELRAANRITLDRDLGHDYVKDKDKRWEYYAKKENKIPFEGLDYLNIVTRGGFRAKSLNVFLAGVNVGKTHILCDLASRYLRAGHKVLYITLEIDELEITKRIDANCLKVSIDDIGEYSKEELDQRFNKLNVSNWGKLIVKEYPASSTDCMNIESLLDELEETEDFVPVVILLDSLNLLNPTKANKKDNLYSAGKAVAEETRDVAKSRQNLRIVSCIQSNREGLKQDVLSLWHSAESKAIIDTADFVLGVTIPEELEEMNLMMCVNLKSRYGNKSNHQKFVMGYNRELMSLYNADRAAQDLICDKGKDIDEDSKPKKPRKRKQVDEDVPTESIKTPVSDFGSISWGAAKNKTKKPVDLSTWSVETDDDL